MKETNYLIKITDENEDSLDSDVLENILTQAPELERSIVNVKHAGDMLEWNCFEICDENGMIKTLIIHDEDLTNEQMGKLMDMFNGHSNSESSLRDMIG